MKTETLNYYNILSQSFILGLDIAKYFTSNCVTFCTIITSLNKKVMKKSLQFCFAICTLLIISIACNTNDDSAVIEGSVFDAQSADAVENALVQITAPGEFNDLFARTNENGQYNIGSIEVDGVTDLTLTASATGYEDLQEVVKITPGENITGVDFDLSAEGAGNEDGDDGGNDGDDGNDGGEQVGGEAGGPAQIQLLTVTSPAINVSETGGITSTTFTFQVLDSASREVARDHEVLFEIIRGPGGGEYITPETGFTNSEGRVTSNLVSGDSSGTVRIEAVIERPDVGLTIRSTPVIVSISSGFPHPDNFFIAPRVYNFDAFGFINESYTNNITASVGDIKGNPVKPGTAVYFSSEYGGLVSGSAVTNINGYATVNFSANGSTPQNHPNGTGFIDITAQTVDIDNNYIEKTFTMLLTTREAAITVTPDNFDISNGETQTFNVTIADRNGYPMAANTQISIDTGPGLVASGDIVDLQLPNYLTPGPGTTEFSFSISDAEADEILDSEGSFTIRVETPSGGVTTKTISGQRQKVIGN